MKAADASRGAGGPLAWLRPGVALCAAQRLRHTADCPQAFHAVSPLLLVKFPFRALPLAPGPVLLLSSSVHLPSGASADTRQTRATVTVATVRPPGHHAAGPGPSLRPGRTRPVGSESTRTGADVACHASHHDVLT
eukprot:685897-Rhodomonas_salina.2